MATKTLEQRVTALESEITRIKKAQLKTEETIPWWQKIRGAFKDDPTFEEAMDLGRQYRESLRPDADDPDGQ